MKLRAPAYPLINVDPYFTVWSMADRLHDVPVKHWTGSDNTLIGVCSVDGEEKLFMGVCEGRSKMERPCCRRWWEARWPPGGRSGRR